MHTHRIEHKLVVVNGHQAVPRDTRVPANGGYIVQTGRIVTDDMRSAIVEIDEHRAVVACDDDVREAEVTKDKRILMQDTDGLLQEMIHRARKGFFEVVVGVFSLYKIHDNGF